MALTPNSVVTPQTPKAYKAQITNATNLAAVTITAGGTNGTKIFCILCSSTDTTARDIQLSILRSAVTYVLSTQTVAVNSGNIAATPTTNMLLGIPGLPLDGTGTPYIILESTDTLQMQTLVQLTAAKIVSCHTVAADF